MGTEDRKRRSDDHTPPEGAELHKRSAEAGALIVDELAVGPTTEADGFPAGIARLVALKTGRKVVATTDMEWESDTENSGRAKVGFRHVPKWKRPI